MQTKRDNFLVFEDCRIIIIIRSKILLLKGTVQRDFLTPVFFTKRLTLVSIDMLKSDFEICRIFAELLILKLSQSTPRCQWQRGVKNRALGRSYFDSFKFPWWAVLNRIVHFLLHCSFKGRGSPSKFLTLSLRCQQWLPAINEAASSDSLQ
jgi:hypothetical protein